MIIICCLFVPVAYAHAEEQNIVMEVEGLNCEVCPLIVKESLSKIHGVKDVIMSPEEEKIVLIADESVADRTLINTLGKAGPYNVRSIKRCDYQR